jgi:hypothetical protein
LSEFQAAAKSKEQAQATATGIEWDEALDSGLNLRGFLTKSVSSASRVQQELERAATELGESTDAMRALADRLGNEDRLIATSPVVRSQLIRILAEKSRPVRDIELMAGPIGQLAVLEGVDPRWLAGRFDAVLRAR